MNRTCKDCGYQFPLVSGVVERDGVLVEFDPAMPQKKGAKREYSYGEKRQFYAELLGYCQEKGYKQGWAANKYREKFDVWPQGMKGTQPVEPSYEMFTWIKSRNIRFWAEQRKGNMQAAES